MTPAPPASQATRHPPPARRWIAWLLIGVITCVGLVDALDSNALIGLLPLIQKELHLTDLELGILTSAFVVSLVLATLPLALAADYLRRPQLIALGVLIWAGCTALGGVVGGFVSLLLVRMWAGLGFASYDAPANAITAATVRARWRSTVLSVQTLGQALIGALGIQFAGAFAEIHGWRATFVVVAAPALVLGVVLFGLREPGGDRAPARLEAAPLPPIPQTDPRSSWLRRLRAAVLADTRAVLTTRALGLALLGIGIQTGSVIAIGTYLPALWERTWHLSNAAAATAFSEVFLALAAGTLPGGLVDAWLRQRLATRSSLIVAGSATTAAGVFFAGALFAPSFSLAFWLTAASAACIGATYGPVKSLIADLVAPTRLSYGYGFQGVTGRLIGALIAPVIGWISVKTGSLYVAMLSLAGLMALAGLPLLLGPWLGRRVRREQKSEQEDKQVRSRRPGGK